jgi:hypothetical protein
MSDVDYSVALIITTVKRFYITSPPGYKRHVYDRIKPNKIYRVVYTGVVCLGENTMRSQHPYLHLASVARLVIFQSSWSKGNSETNLKL